MPEPASLLAVVAIALLGGCFRGFAGFGGGLLMVPLLTRVLPPIAAIPVSLVLNLGGSMRLLYEVRREVDVRRVSSVAIPALLGIPLGVHALTVLDPSLVEDIVSVVVLAMVGLLASGLRFPGAAQLRVLVPVGWLGGLMTSLAGVGGPPVVLAFLSIGDPPQRTRANLIGFFVVGEVAALVMMAIAGVLSWEVAILGGIATPVFMLATVLGSRLFRHAKEGWYHRVALGFLALVALASLLWPD